MKKSDPRMVFARGYALRREARNHPPNHHQCRSVAIPIAEYTSPEQRRGRRPLTSLVLNPVAPPPPIVLAIHREMEEHYGSIEEVLRVLLCSTVPGWDWKRDVSEDAISSALASAVSRQGFTPWPDQARRRGAIWREGSHTVPTRWGTVVVVRLFREQI